MSEKCTALARILLGYRETVKFLHWRTTSYATHIATNGYLEKLDALIDTIIETYSARYGRPSLVGEGTVLNVQDVSDFGSLLVKFAKFLQTQFVPTFLDPNTDQDLVTLRDELLSETMQAKYLSTFN